MLFAGQRRLLYTELTPPLLKFSTISRCSLSVRKCKWDCKFWALRRPTILMQCNTDSSPVLRCHSKNVESKEQLRRVGTHRFSSTSCSIHQFFDMKLNWKPGALACTHLHSMSLNVTSYCCKLMLHLSRRGSCVSWSFS